MADVDQSAAKLLAFTIEADRAQIVKSESLDASSGRHELSEEEKTSLLYPLRERLDEEV